MVLVQVHLLTFTLRKKTNTAYNWHVMYLENRWYKSKLFSDGMSRPQQAMFNTK